MCSNEHVQLQGCLVRDDNAIWRLIAGNVVIAEKDSGKIHYLNKTASVIWSLADGTRKTDDIITELHNKFEVTIEEARTDVEEFCRRLLKDKLISIKENNEKK